MGGNKQHKKQGKSGNKPKHTSGAAAGSVWSRRARRGGTVDKAG